MLHTMLSAHGGRSGWSDGLFSPNLTVAALLEAMRDGVCLKQSYFSAARSVQRHNNPSAADTKR
jgi:hypothetical protein